MCIQGNANVIVLELSNTPSFDFWLCISTLDAYHPIRIPLKLYGKARQAIAEFPKLCTGVTLAKRGSQWYATLVVERRQSKPATKRVVGVDIGMVKMLATSEGNNYGEISQELRERTEKAKVKRSRKQKLNCCLDRKGKPKVDLTDHKVQAFARNEIGRALNTMLDDLPESTAIALERLSVGSMRFKSRAMNRWLSAAQLGYIRDRFKFKLDDRAIRYRSVQPAYSSQQCSHCGFIDSKNRLSQAQFKCKACGFESNADLNASINIAERFGDIELNTLPFRDVKPLLERRYQDRLPVARSATAELGSAPSMAAKAISGQPVQLIPMNRCL
jgi:putative transposase